MGSADKLKKVFFNPLVWGILSFFLVKDYFAPGPNEIFQKKSVLALITEYDPPGVTQGMEKMFKEDFSDLPDYHIYSKRSKSIEEILYALNVSSRIRPLDGLILAYHGEKYSMSVNKFESIDTSNVKEIFERYLDSFSKDAVIILYSCSTGSGEDNIARRISEVLNIDVLAPKVPLIPETSVPETKRIGEFGPDENGRLSFDYKNFKGTFSRGFRFLGPPYKTVSTSAGINLYGKMETKDKGKDLFSIYKRGKKK